MKRRELIWVWIALGACGWPAGCATVPAAAPQCLLQARQSLQAAGNAQADVLAPADFSAARRALQEAESAWAAEKPMTAVEALSFEAQSFADIARTDALRRRAERALEDLTARLAREQEASKEQAEAFQARESGKTASLTPPPPPPAQPAAGTDRRLDEALLGQAKKIKDAEVRLTPRGVVVTLPSGPIFAPNSSQLQTAARPVLDMMADLLRQNPGTHAVIEGYTEHTGDALADNTLSQAQAESVLNYLQQKGVTFDNLQAVGRGGSRPGARPEQTPDRRTNNRLEFFLETGKGAAQP